MRRLLAISMILLFGWTLAAPLLVADAASNLPECCRRNGTHHCVEGMTDESSSRTVPTVAPKCPNFPKAIAAPAATSFASITQSTTGIPLYAHPASAPQTQARYRIANARSRQKRGPPMAIAAS